MVAMARHSSSVTAQRLALSRPTYSLRNCRELCSPSGLGGTLADGGKSLVERALTISLKVQGNVREACRFQPISDGGCHFGREGARHFFGRYFHAREPIVEPHAELAESKGAERCFAALDQSKTLRRHFRAVGQARSEARGGGAAPGRQTRTAPEKARLAPCNSALHNSTP